VVFLEEGLFEEAKAVKGEQRRAREATAGGGGRGAEAVCFLLPVTFAKGWTRGEVKVYSRAVDEVGKGGGGRGGGGRGGGRVTQSQRSELRGGRTIFRI